MQKVIGASLVVAVQIVGAFMIREILVPGLFGPPCLYILFGLLGATCVIYFHHNIRRFLDADLRAHDEMMERAAKEKAEQEQTRRLPHIHSIRKVHS